MYKSSCLTGLRYTQLEVGEEFNFRLCKTEISFGILDHCRILCYKMSRQLHKISKNILYKYSSQPMIRTLCLVSCCVAGKLSRNVPFLPIDWWYGIFHIKNIKSKLFFEESKIKFGNLIHLQFLRVNMASIWSV